MNDPGSLQNLNDILAPAPATWWPPAPGWYAVLAVALVLLTVHLFRMLKAWRKDTYRREALRELDAALAGEGDAASQVPALLKRAALAAWPRQDVACLNGPAWHAFLDKTACTDLFCDGAGVILDKLSYGASGGHRPSGADLEQLRTASEYWLKHHRAEAA